MKLEDQKPEEIWARGMNHLAKVHADKSFGEIIGAPDNMLFAEMFGRNPTLTADAIRRNAKKRAAPKPVTDDEAA